MRIKEFGFMLGTFGIVTSLLSFMILPMILNGVQVNNQKNNSNINNLEQDPNEWTVGVQVGDNRTMTVIYCTGDCVKISPLGTKMLTTILAINSTHITYNRTFIIPKNIPLFLTHHGN